jgi:hypothetical protein
MSSRRDRGRMICLAPFWGDLVRIWRDSANLALAAWSCDRDRRPFPSSPPRCTHCRELGKWTSIYLTTRALSRRASGDA